MRHLAKLPVRAAERTRVEMAVNVPEGKRLDKVELFLNDTRVATLFGPPYVQVVDVPPTDGVGYLRARPPVAKVKRGDHDHEDRRGHDAA